MLSNAFDPRYAFLFYSPLIFSLDRFTGRKLMWVSVIAEWSNQVLKWLMRGERPYWWVKEFEQAQDQANSTSSLPAIQQTFMTCETGPGSPSGHAMVTAAVWYILVEALLKNRGHHSKNSLLNRMCWATYTILVCAVSLSRVYIAAHFPHQCLLGMIIGVAVAMLVSHADTDRVSRNGYILGTAAMFGVAMLTYFLLLASGFNPLWSVERAMKWCAKKEHVHLDTTPFFSMMRYLGFFLGMGLGLHSSAHKKTDRMHMNNKVRITIAAVSVILSKAMERIPLPSNVHVNVVYGCVFAMSVILPYLFIGIVPYLVCTLFGAQPTKKASLASPDQVVPPREQVPAVVNRKISCGSQLLADSGVNDANNNNLRIRSH